MSEILQRKLVLVGNAGVGKTHLIMRIRTGEFPEYSNWAQRENIIEDVQVDGQNIEVAFWETAGQEDYDRLRPLTYPGTDVFLLCFSIDQPESLKIIQEKFHPEIIHFGPNVPYFLVGCKNDLRVESQTIRRLREANSEFVTKEAAEAVTKEIGAVMYCECSAKSGDGVSDLVETASRTALHVPRPKKRIKCVVI
ncbi:GTP-binding protein Rho1 [Serendipita sp. 399]|nr:GTP-binding protein Rho1 [Serendipita sp. 399]